MGCLVKISIQVLTVLVHLILMTLKEDIFKNEQNEQTKHSEYPYHKDKVSCCVDSDAEDREDCLCDKSIVGLNIKNEHSCKVPKIYDNSSNMKSWNMNVDVYFSNVDGHRPMEINGMPWGFMNQEWFRLHSFAKYPREAPFSPILLAREGFVYIGNGDPGDVTVMCYVCSKIVHNLGTSQRVDCLHDLLSPVDHTVDPHNISIEPQRGILFSEIISLLNPNEQILSQNHSPNTDTVTEETLPKVLDIQQENVSFSPMRSLRDRIILQEQGAKLTVSLKGRDIESVKSPGSHDFAGLATGVARFSSSTWNHDQSFSLPDSEVTNAGGSNRSNEAQQLTAADAGLDARMDSVALPVTDSSQPHSDRPIRRQSGSSAHSNQIIHSESSRHHTHSNAINSDASRLEETGNGSMSSQGYAGNSASSPPLSCSDGQELPCRDPDLNDKLGIITTRPKNPEYALEIHRLNSFQGWPQDHHIKAEDLAKAGFFYTGDSDCVCCFYCGGALHNWEMENAWVEHARWFFKCGFLRQTVQQHFIDVVQDLNNGGRLQPQQMSTEMKCRVPESANSRGSTVDGINRLSRHRGENSQLHPQNKCKFCLNKEVSIIFLPCGHFISCNDCSHNLRECPLCKGIIEYVVQ